MEEVREVSVNEFIKSFVTTSYLQEQRIFKIFDIWNYLLKCCQFNYSDEESFMELINETEALLENMVSDRILSYVYSDYGMFRIEDKIDVMGYASHNKEYIEDMVKAFLAITGGLPFGMMRIVPSKTNIKK